VGTSSTNAPSAAPDITLAGKHVLITGGTHGIGYATVVACLDAGANVTLVARNSDDVLRRTKELTDAHGDGRVNGIVGDVSDAAGVVSFFDAAEQRHGRIDGVVNSAGVYGPIGPITEIEPSAWADVIRINLFGTFLVTREACRRMKTAGGGRISLFSGGGAASPFPNYTGYASSKAAVVRLAETVAIEMAPFGIEINAIAPGFVLTRLHDQTVAAGALAGDFLGKTIDVMKSGGVPASVGANAAAFLVSDAAAGITGKFVAAPYDDYRNWLSHRTEIESMDVFTLRRIVPRERGLDWQ
jgi:NAD(P)-dependent dehydrogenase (short-subunit alcohol dehydrogenase family)